MSEIRAVVLGVGNRMRGDDAVGPLVADELQDVEGLKVIDAGTAPENYIEPVVRLNPEKVLIVDACAFGGEPGGFELFGAEDIERLAGSMVSTHTLPLNLTVGLLEQRLTADIRLLGVQPASLEFNAGLSAAVAESLPGLVDFVRQWVGA